MNHTFTANAARICLTLTSQPLIGPVVRWLQPSLCILRLLVWLGSGWPEQESDQKSAGSKVQARATLPYPIFSTHNPKHAVTISTVRVTLRLLYTLQLGKTEQQSYHLIVCQPEELNTYAI